MLAVIIATACVGRAVATYPARGEGQPGSVYMWDLGKPEPKWAAIRQGSAADKAITINSATQVWGNVSPGQTSKAPLCKWTASSRNDGDGDCKTDVSWLHSAVGVSKALFDDPVANYVLRFHMQSACYRSSQYSYNADAHYCAPWYLDPGTNTKINTTDICYPLEWPIPGKTGQDGKPIVKKFGCGHKLPITAAPARRALLTESPAPGPGAASGGGSSKVLTQRSDLVDTTDGVIYNNRLEIEEVRARWYECLEFTAEGSEAREECYNDVAGINFGIDAASLTLMLQLVQNETRGDPEYPGAGCAVMFTENHVRRGELTPKQQCEGETSDWITGTFLGERYGFRGTPQQPLDIAAVISPPPPPPPPTPPPPPLAPIAPPAPLAGGAAGINQAFTGPGQTGVTPSEDSAAAVHGVFVAAAALACMTTLWG